MMYSIQNLGLNMPGQQKPIGYWNSVGTSFGFGDRSDPIKGEKTTVPGPGTYFKPQIDKQLDGENYCQHRKTIQETEKPDGPAWK